MVSGPGTVTFGDANALSTTASFSATGAYVLRLTASDTANTASDDLNVNVVTVLQYTTQYEFDDPTNPDPAGPTGVIDANPADINGAGLLTKVGNGIGNAPGGFDSGTMRYVDTPPAETAATTGPPTPRRRSA